MRDLPCRGCGRLPRHYVSPDSIAYTCARCLMVGAAQAAQSVPENGGAAISLRGPKIGLGKSLKSLESVEGFSGTSQRGGRPRLPDEERKRRERERKRRQRGK